MEPVLIVFLSLAPPLVYTAYLLFSSSLSVSMAVKLFLSSLAAICIVSVLQAVFFPGNSGGSGSTGILVSSFVEAGAIEELCKLLCLIAVARRCRVHTPAVVFALCFAGLETIVYAFGTSIASVPLRFFTSYPVHVGATLVCFLACMHTVPFVLKCVLVFAAVLLHGGFTFCMEMSGIWLSGALVCELLLLVLARVLVRRDSSEAGDV